MMLGLVDTGAMADGVAAIGDIAAGLVSSASIMPEQQSSSQSGKQLSSQVPGHDGSTGGNTCAGGWYLRGWKAQHDTEHPVG